LRLFSFFREITSLLLIFAYNRSLLRWHPDRQPKIWWSHVRHHHRREHHLWRHHLHRHLLNLSSKDITVRFFGSRVRHLIIIKFELWVVYVNLVQLFKFLLQLYHLFLHFSSQTIFNDFSWDFFHTIYININLVPFGHGVRYFL